MTKELEALEDIILYLNASEPKGLYCENIETIKQALLKAEKEHKALEIIKKKNVSVWGFRNRVFGYQKKQNCNIAINDTYEYYLNNFGLYHNGFDSELLTKEEFNLLREVL